MYGINSKNGECIYGYTLSEKLSVKALNLILSLKAFIYASQIFDRAKGLEEPKAGEGLLRDQKFEEPPPDSGIQLHT